jgi:adenylate cyclase
MMTIYTFGPFRLDAKAKILFRGADPVALGQRAVALLRVLVERPEVPVSKDALIQAAWPGLTVEESNLTVQIAALRRVFGDEPGGERWIETLPRRGYRFVGPVVARDQGNVAGAPALALPDRPSIAVLPFANMSGDSEQEYFADGITEDITTALSKWRWFFVIARNSSFTYKGRQIDVKQVGQELGVHYVLEGSVRTAGNRARLTAQLIDAVTGVHIWAERYDRELADMFTILDDVTHQVAAAIEPVLSKIATERARRKTFEQMVARDHYMRGMWHFHQFSEEESDKAIGCFNRAIELDDTLAEAYVGTARTLLSKIMYHFSSESDANAENAFAAARRGLALDPNNPSACYALAMLSAHNDDTSTALEFARRAIELNDNFAPGYFALAVASSFLGRPEDALVAIDRALRLSPSDPQCFAWRAQRASALYLLKRYAEAVDTARLSLGQCWFHTACRVLAASYAQLGMIEPAKETIRELLASDRADKTIAEVIRPFKRAADRDNYSDGLRRARMPER